MAALWPVLSQASKAVHAHADWGSIWMTVDAQHRGWQVIQGWSASSTPQSLMHIDHEQCTFTFSKQELEPVWQFAGIHHW